MVAPAFSRQPRSGTLGPGWRPSVAGVPGRNQDGAQRPVGLQMWSLREYLPKDLAGTLAKIRAMGFREVEGAGLWKHTAGELRAALDAAGLRCRSAHMSFERLRDDAPGALAEAKALGASWVVCPWIPYEKEFTRDLALKSAEAFNKLAMAAESAGLRFAYHCHGYEMLPAPEGTRFDTLAQNTDPKRVTFQIDVFHALYGGTDPVGLIKRYAGRVTSLHLKDLKKGAAITDRHCGRNAGCRRGARHGAGRLARRAARGYESRDRALLYRGRKRRSVGPHPPERRVPCGG